METQLNPVREAEAEAEVIPLSIKLYRAMGQKVKTNHNILVQPEAVNHLLQMFYFFSNGSTQDQIQKLLNQTCISQQHHKQVISVNNY